MTIHTKVSFVKSVMRILGYICIFPISPDHLVLAAIILIGSEIIGILEEMVV